MGPLFWRFLLQRYVSWLLPGGGSLHAIKFWRSLLLARAIEGLLCRTSRAAAAAPTRYCLNWRDRWKCTAPVSHSSPGADKGAAAQKEQHRVWTAIESLPQESTPGLVPSSRASGKGWCVTKLSAFGCNQQGAEVQAWGRTDFWSGRVMTG